ncbi:S26 family signal peptidase [Sphingomonas sp. CL5.1]|uniref:S26 family signal peptidase n=1 Tax=Sphingomonas sp. CL5.1 TaxID=2653203 RepID=UPI0020C69B37|nr:S26 family signal peptidase [Sphingomonas sp. CL5.1]
MPLLAAATGVAAIIASVPVKPVALVWNASASVPVGLYRIAPAGAVSRGMVAAVRPLPDIARLMTARGYLGSHALLLKPVAAIAGQTVCRAGFVITIDGWPVATALRTDRIGRSLPVWTGCRVLPAGTVFLLARSVPASFDGRYFGPVANTRIAGRAIPVWTRP